MADFILFQTTLPDRDAAQHLAERLVRDRIAACVQISGPVTSVYRWHDSVETASEWLVSAKLRRVDWRIASALVAELHPYELPELLAVPVEAVSPAYATWIQEATARK
jgi:periplasmic divalent cation tolerance protein